MPADSSARPVRTTSGAPPSRARSRATVCYAGRVRQAEVEQHAVERFRRVGERFAECAQAHERAVRQRFGELVRHQQRVAVVVLDEQHDKPLLVRARLLAQLHRSGF